MLNCFILFFALLPLFVTGEEREKKIYKENRYCTSYSPVSPALNHAIRSISKNGNTLGIYDVDDCSFIEHFASQSHVTHLFYEKRCHNSQCVVPSLRNVETFTTLSDMPLCDIWLISDKNATPSFLLRILGKSKENTSVFILTTSHTQRIEKLLHLYVSHKIISPPLYCDGWVQFKFN